MVNSEAKVFTFRANEVSLALDIGYWKRVQGATRAMSVTLAALLRTWEFQEISKI